MVVDCSDICASPASARARSFPTVSGAAARPRPGAGGWRPAAGRPRDRLAGEAATLLLRLWLWLSAFSPTVLIYLSVVLVEDALAAVRSVKERLGGGSARLRGTRSAAQAGAACCPAKAFNQKWNSFGLPGCAVNFVNFAANCYWAALDAPAALVGLAELALLALQHIGARIAANFCAFRHFLQLVLPAWLQPRWAFAQSDCNAEAVAAVRRFVIRSAQFPYYDSAELEFTGALLPPLTRRLVDALALAELPPAYMPLFERLAGRFRYGDRMVAEAMAAGDQVVVLGAGFDSRPYRFRARGAASVLEVDRAELQAVKLQRLAAALPLPRLVQCCRGVAFAACDFASSPNAILRTLEAAAEAGQLDPKKNILYVLEGVVEYLMPEDIANTFRCLRRFRTVRGTPAPAAAGAAAGAPGAATSPSDPSPSHRIIFTALCAPSIPRATYLQRATLRAAGVRSEYRLPQHVPELAATLHAAYGIHLLHRRSGDQLAALLCGDDEQGSPRASTACPLVGNFAFICADIPPALLGTSAKPTESAYAALAAPAPAVALAAAPALGSPSCCAATAVC